MVCVQPQRWFRSYARAASILALLVLFSALLIFSPLNPTRPFEPERLMESVYHIERQAQRDGWTPALARQAGDLWRQSGDLVRAAAYWENAGDDPPVVRALAQAYVELDEWARAVDTLERLIRFTPDDAWANFQLGVILAAVAPDRALPYLNAALPAYGDSLTEVIEGVRRADPLRVGRALAEARLWAYAELAFEQVGSARAYAYGGYVRDQQGKDGGALMQMAVALAPDDPQVRLLEGLHYRVQGDYATSLQAIIGAAALDPENPTLYAELGTAYDLAGDALSARRWLEYAVTLSGNDPQFAAILAAFDADQQALLDVLGVTDEPTSEAAATPTPVG